MYNTITLHNNDPYHLLILKHLARLQYTEKSTQIEGKLMIIKGFEQ